ncbi:MAG TPA: HlyD family type I secretion periplasmic adaptor subunit [Albitalea sp.]
MTAMPASAASMALPASDPVAPHVDEARRLVRRGIGVLLLGLLPVLAWLALAPLASAVVAPAFVKVDLDRRPVQHAEGGLVREVLVRDGQRVKQGEPMLVLGDVAVDADVNRLSYRVMAERVGIARLEAEQSAAASLAFPQELLRAGRSDPRLAELLERESNLFEAHRHALRSQVGLLLEQRTKVLHEMEALRAQIRHARASLQFQRDELETHRGLLAQGFVSSTRIAQLEASVADYGAKIEERRSELARAEQRHVDADLRIRTLESEHRQRASAALKVAAAQLSEVEQELRKSSDASARQSIVAPASGEVIDLKVTSPGAIVAPRETIASIVPAETRLVSEARIRTEDVARVRRGQPAEIRFTAFKSSTTRLVQGEVIYVSADRLIDPATNGPYFAALVEADPASLVAMGDLKLVAGMPAEVYIKGERRTALEYLLEPLMEMWRRAGRER